MDNLNKENRFRCYWCRGVMDGNLKILKNKEERDKFENVDLPETYCKECYETLLEENGFYDD